MPVVAINSKEELQKVLAIQKLVSEAALQEIAPYAGVSPPDFIKGVSKVLEKYARYATLTEFKQIPSLADSEKWGATFGVTALVAGLVLEHSRVMLRVSSDLKLEYLRFLAALDETGNGAIEMDALTRLFAMLSDSYGIVWSKETQLSLTVVGRRVYLHLLDAMKFIDDVTAASAKFQES